ncbi:MAG: type II secretion system F family protein [Brevibacillus sp.]|nr:type II secretion system F family protein [Brevibacillus sp.]
MSHITVSLVHWAVFGSALFASMTLLEALLVRKRLNGLKKVMEPLYRMGAQDGSGLLARLGSWFNRTEYGKEMDKLLKSVHMNGTPIQWLLLWLGSWLLLCLVIRQLLGLGFPYNVLVAYLFIKVVSRQWFKSRRHKLTSAVTRQLPEVCRLLASSTKAGHSIQQGLEMVAAEIKPPAGYLFQSIVSEVKMGRAMDTVMSEVKQRVDSKELNALANMILLQHRVGGNLPQVLGHLAKTLEERERLHKEIRNSSAEPRFVALLLSLMPVVIIVLFNFAFDGFAMLMFTVPGMILTALSVFLITLGLVVVRKISNIRV